MFTGIVEELGVVERLEPLAVGARLRVRCRRVLEDAFPGASVLVNGVCLTVTEIGAGTFTADVAPETLRRSNLGRAPAGGLVNLERPLAPSGRLGGHIVQGHVDGTGRLEELRPLGDGNWWLTVQAPPEVERYLVFKGSIAIDGISLTIVEAARDRFSVTVIPHTYQNTNLRTRRAGDTLNLECDILAKYVEKMLDRLEQPSRLTAEKLRDLGY